MMATLRDRESHTRGRDDGGEAVTPSPLLAAAFEAAAAGWAVFPCLPSGPRAKSPLTEHGHLDATRDPAVITAWWTRYQYALIGHPCRTR